jgi:hypothetical protein
MADQIKLLKVGEAAAFLGISPGSLYHWRSHRAVEQSLRAI